MNEPATSKWSAISKTVFIGFCMIAAALIIFEHRLHVLGYLPFLFLLACPLMHLFMHHGHGHNHRAQQPAVENKTENAGGPDHA